MRLLPRAFGPRIHAKFANRHGETNQPMMASWTMNRSSGWSDRSEDAPGGWSRDGGQLMWSRNMTGISFTIFFRRGSELLETISPTKLPGHDDGNSRKREGGLW